MFLLAAALAMTAPVPKSPDWVTVKGTVVWPEKEKIPEAKAIDLSNLKEGDIDYLRKSGAAFDDKFLVDEKSRGLKNVVVWLRPDDDDPKAKIPAEKIHPDLVKAKPTTHTLTNEFCRFDRRVVVARAGDTLEVVSKSSVAIAPSIQHGDDRDIRTLTPGKDPIKVENLKAGAGLFHDALHDQWKNGVIWSPGRGFLRVFDHPYFALTNESGEFEIKQVPKGKWRIMYWHETGYHKGKDGRLGFPIEVEGNKQGEMTTKPLAFEVPKK